MSPLSSARRLVAVGAATVGLAVAAACGAASPGEADPVERPAAAAQTPCSGRGLPASRPRPDLPDAVDDMRRSLLRAARRCDWRELRRLADVVGAGVEFSFGAERSATRYWRRLEADPGVDPKPMEALVRVLRMPSARNEIGFYVWPSAHRLRPTARDWRALRPLYSREVIRQMREGGSYLGWRVGIGPHGDWQFYVAGD